MSEKKSFSFKTILTLSIVSACLLVMGFVLAMRAFRSTLYVIYAEDKIYDEYIKEAPLLQKGLRISFVKASERELVRQKTFGPIIKVAGNIQPQEEIVLVPQVYGENQKFFLLSQEPLLPSVKADFSSANAVDVNAPEFGISISSAKDLPLGNRALPLDGKYADDVSYKLTVKHGVLCTVFEKQVAEEIFDYCEKVFITQEKKTDPNLVTIVSVGDIMVARGVQEILLDRADGLEAVFEDTLPILKGADFTIGNLEGVVTESWKNATKTYTFKFKKAVLPKLLDAGFDYLMQTNNHCYDYGESGFRDTLAAFAEYKIPSSGIGKNKEEAKKFYHTTIKGLPISVISCGAFPVERSGFNGEKTATATESRAGILWQSDDLLEDIKAEKKAGYFVIVNVHGGEEYHFTPSKKQRSFYEALCDSGADVVFGSHPHVLQPTEWHGKSLIVFSMGNFIFNGMENMRGGTDSELVKIGVLDGRIAYVEQYPAKIKNNGVRLKK